MTIVARSNNKRGAKSDPRRTSLSARMASRGKLRGRLTHKGRKIIAKREPCLIEEPKQAIFIRGRKTSQLVMECMRNLYSLKKPDAVMLNQKNDILPFEIVQPVENFCRKRNSPLFMFGSASKKRPNNVIIGRMFQNQLLDMVELGIEYFKSMKEFNAEKISSGIKSCLLFTGELFESSETLIRLKNLLIDFFNRTEVEAIRLQGLEHVMMFTATSEESLSLRSYRVILKKSGVEVPRVELEEIGPAIDFKLRRVSLASPDLFKTSCKKPKELKAKTDKNISKNVFGTTEGRVHIPKQKLGAIQTRKMKGLKKTLSEKKAEKKNKQAAKNAAAEPDRAEPGSSNVE